MYVLYVSIAIYIFNFIIIFQMDFAAKNKEKSLSKSLSFSEINIRQTLQRGKKDYGWLKFRETKAIDPNSWRKKLLACIRNTRESDTDADAEGDINDYVCDLFTYLQSQKKKKSEVTETFEQKRKKFYSCEFTLAQQRPMSDLRHPPAILNEFKRRTSRTSASSATSKGSKSCLWQTERNSI